ncbi:cyclic peptide export ABC transporter [Mucilaginibacter sp. SJ]|uniref:cyclic peptide export ABC transporter n=1 Tax=Mucilaginibacter sp. SJ TaxID=3029053 RepID=UPI0023A981FB|nr:cyclic peptide export ABC transporter [Mucilaginibacter sp. SJ]WEA01646.1 cyclic peptide export ABC transporter [Mucilaginibacter sp. SJ]
MRKITFRICLIIIIVLHCEYSFSNPDKRAFPVNWNKDFDKEITESFGAGKIPGMSIVIVYGDKMLFKSYGYANIEKKIPVNPNTLFQIGSCSKAFTALAVMKLAKDGLISLDDNVSKYIPWFKVYYKNNKVEITIRQLLHQSSGIPWNTIAKIPESNVQNALDKTVKTIVGIQLHRLPGQQFEYATINYDILALAVEKITRQSFENYLQQQILAPMQLDHTSLGVPKGGDTMSEGYKIGFLKPRRYDAPVYRGNNPAGYVITNALDMAKWLRFQMGSDHISLADVIEQTHQRDETVPPLQNYSYASGWYKSLNGDNLLFHSGHNPNFTAFVGFDPSRKYGVAVLANSNSAYTEIIGNNILNMLASKAVSKEQNGNDNNDGMFSIATLILGAYILVVLAFMAYVIAGIIKGGRISEQMNLDKVKEPILIIVLLIPFLYGVYKLPNAIAGFNWSATRVWMPQSFFVMIVLLLAAILVSYIAYFLTLYFPDQNKYRGAFPKLLLISAISGIANMVLILLITSALKTDIEVKFILFYFGLVLSIYLAGRRFVQVKLIKITRDLIYDLRIKLIDRIFNTSYQKFEKIDSGRIYTAFNDDVGTIGESTNMFIMLVTNLFTAIAAMLYLASIAFWATVLIILLIIVMSSIYYFVGRSTHRYFEEARDSRTVFMRLLNGMIDGYKEISMHLTKKILYKNDVSESANEYRLKMSTASILYVNASLVGEIVLVSILGTVAFGFPILFPGIPIYAISMFIVVLLYLIGPVNAILQSVPVAMRLNIAWKRVQQFIKEIPANYEMDYKMVHSRGKLVYSLRTENLRFTYEDEHQFDVGPVNLEVNSGEILFIIGGNGSGKTTLAKLLTGLYEPTEGKIYVNGKEEPFSQLGEHFSIVFNPLYLFEKLYDIEINEKKDEIKRYLNLLDMQDKVQILEDGTFSTTSLSGGQRKRLALLLCYLEDSPIYLFDEWAADQDPEYRRFFYKTLLPEMRKMGKMVIAITHDDHYFDVADKVVKMNRGKLEEYSANQHTGLGY